MKLGKIAKWLAVAAVLGAIVAGVAFQEASIKINGETLSIQQLLTEGYEIQ